MQTVKKIISKSIEKKSIEDQGNIIGIITETDIVRKVGAQDMSLQDTLASKIMNFLP
jgi:predicted transcriptional regulator|tara:strand:+ start:458 stop:628 length:171 start_codon:yes stop_codon:yes gene_type:complete